MPPLPSAPTTLKCQLLWNDSADLDVTTGFFFNYTGSAPSATDCSNLATALINAMTPHKVLWHPSVDLVGAKVTDLSSSTANEGQASSATAGTSTGEMLAGGTCTVINYTLSRRYRGGKPRNYFPWGDAGVLQTRQAWQVGYTEAVASSIADFFTAFIGVSEGGTTVSNHVNVSYYSGSRVVTSPTTGRARNVPILRAAPLVNNIESFSVMASPGSQRRRNR